MPFSLIYDTATGLVLGSHLYVGSRPSLLPANEIPCLDNQAATWSSWQVVGGSLVPYAAPAPTLAQQAETALLAGLTVTFTGSLSYTATFPCDPTTQSKIAPMADMASKGVLPAGHTTYDMKTTSGTFYSFTAAQYQAVAAAIASYAAALVLLIDGNATLSTLPSSSISLTV